MSDEWDKYAVCDCGWRKRCPFGRLFHLHVEVCPDCGSSKSNMKVVTARKVYKPGGWFGWFGTYEWEEK